MPKTDAEIIRMLLQNLVAHGGRGSLTWMAARLGITPSRARKRLYKDKRGLDEVTMRAYILAIACKAKEGEVLTNETTVGNIIFGVRENGHPAWRQE